VFGFVIIPAATAAENFDIEIESSLSRIKSMKYVIKLMKSRGNIA